MSEMVNAAVLPVLPGMPVQASSDPEMVDLWLDRYRPLGQESRTSAAYAGDVRAFQAFVGGLRTVTVRDVQLFAASLTRLAPASAARRLSAVKSLLGFAHRVGYVAFDCGAPVRLPVVMNRLSERIMPEADVLHLLRMTANPRNAALLGLIYGAGLRLAEVCGLRWRDVVKRDHGEGQINVLGKRGKTRTILLPAKLYARVAALRGKLGPDDAVFHAHKKGGPLGPGMVHKIVKEAAKRARLSPRISAHYLRHAHASHALDRNCPIHLVQATLGHASVATTGLYLHARPGDSSARYLAGG